MDGIFEKQSPDLRGAWQRRYFVLRGNTIFYWKEQEGAEIGQQQGDFLLHSTSSVSDVKSKGRYFHFAINQVDRSYKLRCDTASLAESWVKACREVITRRKGMDGEDSGISDPFNTTHEQHVDFELKWAGTKAPDDVFEKGMSLGKGAYGSVCEARHRDSGFVVALKIVPLGNGVESLQKEIDVLKRCKHANIVEYFGTLINNNEELWILMDNCEVGSVRDVMQTNLCTLEEEQISVVVLNVAKGLSYLHNECNIIHFDIKAANILINKSSQIKLADFGVSEQLEGDLNQSADLCGSPLWMSPEVILRQPYTNRTDVWSLGITVIEMADGCAPLAGNDPMQVIKVIPERPPPTVTNPKAFSDDFNDFVAQCLIKDHEERPSSLGILVHPFIQTTKGPEVLRQLILETLRNKQEKKLIAMSKATVKF